MQVGGLAHAQSARGQPRGLEGDAGLPEALGHGLNIRLQVIDPDIQKRPARQQVVGFLRGLGAEGALQLGDDELRQQGAAAVRQPLQPRLLVRGQGRRAMAGPAEQGGDLVPRQLVVQRQGRQHGPAPAAFPAPFAQAVVDAVGDRAPIA